MFRQKDPFADKVKCEECRHWVDNIDAYPVLHNDLCRFRYTSPVSSSETLWYCKLCKKEYFKITTDGLGETRYYKEIEVDEKGEPIGYAKINV